MVHLIHRKWVPLLHNKVLILCDEGDGLVAVNVCCTLLAVMFQLAQTHLNAQIWYLKCIHSKPLHFMTSDLFDRFYISWSMNINEYVQPPVDCEMATTYIATLFVSFGEYIIEFMQ